MRICTMRTSHWPGSRGFSLIEISLVLIIAGLALGGLLAVLGPQLEQRKYSETQRQLKDASDALLAFAMVQRRLPCPATATSNGREVFCTAAAGGCGAQVVPPATSLGSRRGRCFAAANAGWLPAATLGLGGMAANGALTDSWGGAIRYRVTDVTPVPITNNPAVTLPDGACSGAIPCFPYTQFEGVRNSWYASGVPTANPMTSTVFACSTATGLGAGNCGAAPQLANPVFVVYSYGRNGNAAPIGLDETANVNADSVYVLHGKSEAAATNGAFDDLFEWATIPQLVARMQGNGVLP